jgi:hypothetical protein
MFVYVTVCTGAPCVVSSENGTDNSSGGTIRRETIGLMQ